MLVAGLVSGVAYAQNTNVTLYGSMHAGYVYSKADHRKFSGIEDGTMGASQVGIRGEENLGNGLKAVFDANWRIREDTGSLASRTNSDRQFLSDARWTYVGLAGNFGTVTIGRVRMISDEWSGIASSMGWTGITAANTLGQRFTDVLSNARWDNSIKYVSPNFSGLDFTAVYSFGERTNAWKNRSGAKNCESPTDSNADCNKSADTTDAGKLGLGLRYANGPVSLIAIYEARADNDGAKPYTGAENEGYGAKGWRLGGAYDFNVVKVYASYSRVKANHNGLAYEVTDGGSDKQTLWSLGLSAPVSAAGKVWFEYAQYKDYLNHGLRISDEDERLLYGRTAGHKSKGYSLGYEHTLSKRTSLHAFVTRFNVDRGIDNSAGVTNVPGENQNVFALGIRHNF
jgi:predicted porin